MHYDINALEKTYKRKKERRKPHVMITAFQTHRHPHPIPDLLLPLRAFDEGLRVRVLERQTARKY